MGYKEGKGLGKNEQGLVDIIPTSNQKGRRGLGYSLSDINVEEDFEWSAEREKDFVCLTEDVKMLGPHPDIPPDKMDDWMKLGKKKLTIHDEMDFCDGAVVKGVINCKNVFDKLSGHELRRARSMSNPFEMIEKGIFQNRAAMKMANLDYLFNYMFTDPKQNELAVVSKYDLLYFADICAGPGGFSEYVLWRKGWEARGFGFTLRGDNDFKLEDFYAGSSETFEPHYGEKGKDGDGNIYNPQNLIAFRNHVLNNTENKGVHFVMADGGFSVEGKENIQEILSKRLYLCQFLCALGILRTGGHFVCKLFDIFTSFSVGLIYIMYRCFDEICIVKPNTSRPANSERYLVCKGKREGTHAVENYLFKLNCHLDCIAANNEDENKDIVHAVPLNVIKADKDFYDYICESNDILGRRQILFLTKVKAYAEDESLVDTRQHELKRESFALWNVPLRGRLLPKVGKPEDKFKELIGKPNDASETNVYAYKPTILTKSMLLGNRRPLEFPRNFKCVVLSGEDVASNSIRTDRGFFMGLGKCTTYYWDGSSLSRWKKLENAKIPFPVDTLVYAEFVQELKGEGRAQRRSTVLHIIDALFIGSKDVRNEDYDDRVMYAAKLLKAITKPTIPDYCIPRIKQSYNLVDIEGIFQQRMDMRECKGGNQKFRLCYDIDNERFIDPCGLLIFRTVNDKYICTLSKSSNKCYYFNKQTKQSVFDKPASAVAKFAESYATRIFWRWDIESNLKEEPNERLKEDDGIDRFTLRRFINEKK